MKKTARGFGIFSEFKDSKGNTVRVQKSSAACVDAAWIFVTDPEGESAVEHMGALSGHAAHLTKAQARRLIRGLLKFVNET